MIRTACLLVLATTLAALPLAAPPKATGCAPAPFDGERVDISAETALIVWDEATKTEHFVRRATFQSTAYDFGFLVPTPSTPELDEASDEAFLALQRATAPAVEHRTRTADLGFGCGRMGAKFDAAAEPTGGVEVVQRKRVGDHDAVTVRLRRDKADDPAAGAAELAAWLVRYGYGFGDNLKAWLVSYVRDGWVVTAFRIVGEPAGPAELGSAAATRKDARPHRNGGRGASRLGAKPVRMSFRTDRPFFPYREPADQRDDRAKLVPRSLRVFFAADRRYVGQLGDGSAAWPGRTVWSDKLPGSVRADVLSKAKLPAGAGSREWWLTEFEDYATPRPGTDEVYFSPSTDQSPVARPPVVVWTDNWTPWYVGLAVVFGLPALFVAGLLVRRLARRG